MSRPEHYIEIDGQAVAVSYEQRKAWRIRNTDWSTKRGNVSTIFLGHDMASEGPPMTYETRIDGGPLHLSGERYSTRVEAIAGHQRWVERDAAATLEADRAEWARLTAVYGEGGP